VSGQPWDARRLLITYGLGLAGAFLASVVLATAGDWWEHRTGNPALLLLPVSNIRFWFPPLAAAVCAGAAFAGGRRSSDLLAATGVLSVACVWSVVFWYGTGRQVGSEWTSADVSSIMAERGLYQLAGGSLSLLGIALSLIGIVRSIRPSRGSDRAG
jgi:hypothetical protein